MDESIFSAENPNQNNEILVKSSESAWLGARSMVYNNYQQEFYYLLNIKCNKLQEV